MRALFVLLLAAAVACGGSNSTAPVTGSGGPTTDGGSGGGTTGGGGSSGGGATDGGTTTGGGGTPRTFQVQVMLNGAGTVRSTPAGLDCGLVCNSPFTEGETVALSATPATGYDFTGFGGACSGLACQLHVTADAQVWATFTPRAPSSVTLSLQLSGTGAGHVVSTPAGLDCTGSCSASFPAGTSVSLAATPGALSRFDGFGGACSGSACTVTLAADKSVSASFRQQRYHVVDLGTPNSAQYSYSTGAALSPGGTFVAGIWQDGQNGGGLRGFLWDGSFRDLGSNQVETVTGVDESGTAVGMFFVPNQGGHAYRWRAGVFTDLGTLGGSSSAALHLSTAGVVVGTSARADNQTRAVYWNASGITDLGSLGSGTTACSEAHGINAQGIIVGSSCVPAATHSTVTPYAPGPPPPYHAVRFRNPSVIDDLGTLGGPYSYAQAINDGGLIVGAATLADGSIHGFLYGSSMADAGALPGGKFSELVAINARGVAVGNAVDPQAQLRAAIYADGRLLDLNGLADGGALLLQQATAIDDAGDIACTAQAGGTVHAALLRPY